MALSRVPPGASCCVILRAACFLAATPKAAATAESALLPSASQGEEDGWDITDDGSGRAKDGFVVATKLGIAGKRTGALAIHCEMYGTLLEALYVPFATRR